MSSQPSLFAAEPAANGPADLGWDESTARGPLQFRIPPGTPASACRSCEMTIFWVVTARGRKMPVDGDGTSHFATCPDRNGWRSPR